MTEYTITAPASAHIFTVFHEKLRTEWKSKAYCGREYYLSNDIVKWMRRTDTNEPTINAGLLLTEVYKSQPSYVHNPSSSKISDNEHRCLIVFAILLELGYGHLIDVFQRYGIIDGKLPTREIFDAQLPEKCLKDGGVQDTKEFWERFHERMWLYYPCPLKLGMSKVYPDPGRGRYIMPFCRRQQVNDKGGTAQVWEVAVQESLVPKELSLAVGRSEYKDPIYGTCYVFAVKTFTEEHLSVFEWEREAYLAVQAKPDLPGMVRFLGDYEIDERLEDGQLLHTWNLILEYGDEDLEEFFASSRNYPPNLNPETIQFWKSLANVAEALDAIHNLELERENGQHDCFSGFHCDLKPDNILRVDGEFKLADFGFAKFKPTKLGSFPLRSRITGGTETYGAPECDRARRDSSISVSQTIDTWSFGCVLSVSATWAVLGYQGVLAYHELRRIAIRKLRERRVDDQTVSVPVADDAFHNGLDVLPEVKEWHNYLRSVLRRSDTATGRILNLVEECMLLDESARQSKTKALHIVMEEQLQGAQLDYDKIMKREAVESVTESVKEALLSVEDRERPVYSHESEATNARESPFWYSHSPLAPVQRNQSKYSRIKKSKKMNEVVQGKVAHRQDALKLDERRSNSITAGHLGSDSFTDISLVPKPLRIQPVQSSNLYDSSARPALGSRNSVDSSAFVEKEAVASDPLTTPHIRISQVNGPHVPYGSSEESRRREEYGSIAGVGARSSACFPTRPESLDHSQAPIPTSSETSQWNSPYQYTQLPIYQEYQALKNKGVVDRLFRKDHDDYLKKFLVNRDIMFVVDNDTSMAQHWETMSIVLDTLVSKVERFDKNGLDLEFTIGQEHSARNISRHKLLTKFEGAKREASSRQYHIETDMARVLTNIFDKYLDSPKRAMTLIVLTDGNWGGTVDNSSIEKAIADFLKKSVFTAKLEKRWFTIQFIYFGHEIPEILSYLDDEIGKKYSIPDVVDTEHVAGDMYKMILGSFVGQFDIVQSPISPTSPSTPSRPDFPPTPTRQNSRRSIGGFPDVRNYFKLR